MTLAKINRQIITIQEKSLVVNNHVCPPLLFSVATSTMVCSTIPIPIRRRTAIVVKVPIPMALSRPRRPRSEKPAQIGVANVETVSSNLHPLLLVPLLLPYSPPPSTFDPLLFNPISRKAAATLIESPVLRPPTKVSSICILQRRYHRRIMWSFLFVFPVLRSVTDL